MFLLMMTIAASTQVLTNKGAKIFITGEANLVLESDFVNLENGNVFNAGTLSITGNWTNDAGEGHLLQGSTGKVVFNGSTPQYISGLTQTWFHRLDILSHVALLTTTSFDGELNMNGYYLILDDSDLIAEGGAEINGAGSDSYILIGGAGRLIREVDSASVLFPVGTFTAYTPCRLSNKGIKDSYGVRVLADVRTNGTTGSTIPEIDHCVILTWDINEQSAGGSDLTLKVFWNQINEGSLFDRTHAGIGVFSSGSWSPQGASGAGGSGPWWLTRTGITQPYAFAVGDDLSPMAVLLMAVDLKTFLEGPYNGAGMNTDLNNASLLPLSQPYGSLPWNYDGDESVEVIPNPDVVDWVLVELRDASVADSAFPETVIARQAGFVLNDGSVVAVDGVSPMQFDVDIQYHLFAVVYHRNHLAIMSSAAVSDSAGVRFYDFTDGAAKVYGGIAGHKFLGNGVWGMAGGDVVPDDTIGFSDLALWKTLAGRMQYLNSDANLDGETDNKDKNELIIENKTRTSQVPR